MLLLAPARAVASLVARASESGSASLAWCSVSGASGGGPSMRGRARTHGAAAHTVLYASGGSRQLARAGTRPVLISGSAYRQAGISCCGLSNASMPACAPPAAVRSTSARSESSSC
jgi:hypothetical protein